MRQPATSSELTPMQYAILRSLVDHPGIDQVSLAGLAAIDTSTGATVCARLEEKGLLERKVIPTNRRQRALTITPAGAQRLLAPLTDSERRQFMHLLAKLVKANNEESRAPQAAPGGSVLKFLKKYSKLDRIESYDVTARQCIRLPKAGAAQGCRRLLRACPAAVRADCRRSHFAAGNAAIGIAADNNTAGGRQATAPATATPENQGATACA